ncbi:Ribosomal large subunit pseudouridine synthase D OS=Borrelia burgdorferi (strain ATCC 35210 / B31 / CIP 102532 / DSM 4680) GN=rluD PE=3 SV=2 [Rhizoctonia solani AG-1 IB]|uniref:Ribosomal large subunit pseudouridine synthase D n=1 Tax=Thanatephorus cucumeris (strain AG1-IB / isolate 7/3/14) TaxID=1108050 RepID=A0A0B7FNY2_THACB|nr:Ribosomal large subunit pseudouridine synthase D OS=Borrelia burgdorferi (strain ATCC 35210 / B31 / CIP 102532 / DSM 4680) GN=rluD PE=3 SV=2 [Rhizoctonia solani AG-1 IB]
MKAKYAIFVHVFSDFHFSFVANWKLQSTPLCSNGLIILNKPAGLVAQGGEHALESKTKTLEYILEDLTTSLSLRSKPLPVHRLDKQTTGALILARNPQVAQALSSQLRRSSTSTITKTYLAVVRGSFEPYSSGEVRKNLFIDNGRVSTQRTSKEADCREVPTHTIWRCLSSTKGISLMELGLRTGAKHQLRVTMAQILNAPILGDHIYGVANLGDEPGLMLHSASLDILRYLRKPVFGNRTYRLGLVIPPPSAFLSTCKSSGLSIDERWTKVPVRVTIDGLEIPYDPSSSLDEEAVIEALRKSRTGS